MNNQTPLTPTTTKSRFERANEPASINGEKIEQYAAYSRKVFTEGWKQAIEWSKELPEKDAQDLTVRDYYDLRMRVAQHIAIEVGKIIRKERF